MRFMGKCPRCSGQLVLEPGKDEDVYCWNCAYRKPSDADLIFDTDMNRYRPMTREEMLSRPGYNEASLRKPKRGSKIANS